MKTLKSILVLTILFVSSAIFAQPSGGGQKGGHQGPPPIPDEEQITEMVSDLADNLSLSEAQEEKALALYKAHFVQVKEKTSENSRPDREEMQALQAALEKNVKAELTDDQKSKYEAYLKKQSKKRPQRRK